MSADTELPVAAWLAALSALPGMGPVRLRAQLADRPPAEAWQRILAGHVEGATDELVQRWRAEAVTVDVAALWAAHQQQGIRVLVAGEPGWPEPLVDDPEPPGLLFVAGDPSVLDRPRVAVVGTRRCSSSGRAVARQLGHDLADAGVCVLSGLALGVDGAAHGGALSSGGAPPAAVVATGLDVVYPLAQAELWRAVAERGVVLSEYPLGTTPERWRFPARNRIIAALADVVVVVESHARGGSLHTVEAALDRDRTVMAVPGSVRSPASVGTNALLAAGLPPCRDAGDVLVALGLDRQAWSRRPVDPPPGGDEGAVLDAVGWEPSTLEQVADRLAAPLGPVAVHLAALEQAGWIVQRAGWYERSR